MATNRLWRSASVSLSFDADLRGISSTSGVSESMASESGCGDAQSLNIVRLVASGWDRKELWAVAQVWRNQPDGSDYCANPETLSLKCKLISLALAILWMEGKAIAGQAIASLRARLYRP